MILCYNCIVTSISLGIMGVNPCFRRESKMKRLLAAFLLLAGIFFLYKVATTEALQPRPVKVSMSLGYDRPVAGQQWSEEHIRWMQTALNRCIEKEGLEAELLEVDGRFGPASQRTTAAFQSAVGLPDDGTVNTATLEAMINILDDGRTSLGKENAARDKWTLETGTDSWTLIKQDQTDGARLRVDYSKEQTPDGRSTTVTVTDEDGNSRQLTLTTRKAQ